MGVPDAFVKERGVPGAVLVKSGELLREEPGHPFEDLSRHVVHPWPCPVTDQVILDRALLETLERPQYYRAVVGFVGVPGHLDPVALDAGAIADPPQGILPVPRLPRQRGEPGRGRVTREVVPEGRQGTGANVHGGQVFGE